MDNGKMSSKMNRPGNETNGGCEPYKKCCNWTYGHSALWWIIKLVVVVIVFCTGYRLGEYQRYLRGGYEGHWGYCGGPRSMMYCGGDDSNGSGPMIGGRTMRPRDYYGDSGDYQPALGEKTDTPAAAPDTKK